MAPPVRALAKYIRRCADRMRLTNWRFAVVIVDKFEDEEHDAETLITDASHSAQLGFLRQVFEQSPEDQRLVVTHELLHVHCARLAQFAYQLKIGAEGFLGNVAEGLLDDIEEEIVDELSQLIAPSLALPPWCAKTPVSRSGRRKRRSKARRGKR